MTAARATGTRSWRRRATALAVAAALAGCGAIRSPAPDPAQAWQPPARPLVPGLTAADELLAAAAMTAALDQPEQGVPVAWRNPASRSSGSVTVTRSFLAAPRPERPLLGAAPPPPEGLVCRSFEERVTVAGRETMMPDVACRIVDRWELVPAKGGWRAATPRSYTVARRSRLAEVAKATAVPVGALRLLNPTLRDPVPAGTVLRLPTPR